MMYEAYQAQTDLLWPLRTFTKAALPMLKDNTHGWSRWMPNRKLAAAWEVFSRLRLTHQRPSFGIDSVQVASKPDVNHVPEPSSLALVPLALALRAGFRMRARLGARAMTRLALFSCRHDDLGLLAAEGFFQADLVIIAQVGAARRSAALLALGAEEF